MSIGDTSLASSTLLFIDENITFGAQGAKAEFSITKYNLSRASSVPRFACVFY